MAPLMAHYVEFYVERTVGMTVCVCLFQGSWTTSVPVTSCGTFWWCWCSTGGIRRPSTSHTTGTASRVPATASSRGTPHSLTIWFCQDPNQSSESSLPGETYGKLDSSSLHLKCSVLDQLPLPVSSFDFLHWSSKANITLTLKKEPVTASSLACAT